MPFERFYDELPYAMHRIRDSAKSSHGKIVKDIKAQVGNLSFVEKLVRGKLPLGSSDYERIIDQETFYKPLVRSSLFVGCYDPVLTDEANKRHGLSSWATGTSHFARIGNRVELQQALQKGHVVNGLLIENHFIAMLWCPEYSTSEKVVLGAVEFVKFAAALYSAVTSFGTAVGSVIDAAKQIHSAATMVINAAQTLYNASSESALVGAAQQLYGATQKGIGVASSAGGQLKTAASSLGTGIGSALEGKEHAQNLTTVGDRPTDTSLGSRATMDARGGTDWQTRKYRAGGLDLSKINYGNMGEADREQAERDHALLSRMAFVAVQQIRPVRTSMDGDVTMVKEECGAAKHLITTACRYSVKVEAAPVAVVRVGPVTRDVAAAAASAIQTRKDDELMKLIYPWDPRGIVDAPYYFEQCIRKFGQNYTSLDLTEKTQPLPDVNWEGRDWLDTRERYPVELSLPKAGILTAVANTEQKLLSKLGGIRQRKAEAERQRQQQETERQRVAGLERERLRQEATKRRLPSAERFKQDTYRFMGTRDPLLKTVDQLLAQYETLPASAFVQRAALVVSIDEFLTTYLRNKPHSTKRAVIEALMTDLRAEKRALDNVSA